MPMLARLLVAPMLLSPWPQHANAPAVLMRAPADVAPPVEEPLLEDRIAKMDAAYVFSNSELERILF